MQAFVGVSTEPPLVMIAVDKTSRTLADLKERHAFVINFLKAGSEKTSDLFASKSEDKFSGVAWRPSKSARGAPVLDGAIVAYAECVVEQALEAGDHWLFVARVEGGEVFDGAPLIYYRRTYAAWPLEAPAPIIF